MRTPSVELADVTAFAWLQSAGQSSETIQAFWDIILVSALGEKTSRVSMASARKVMVDGFASARGASDVLIPTLPLSELLGRRLVEQLSGHGVEVRTGTPVRRIGHQSVATNEEREWSADVVICAVPWYRLASLFGAAGAEVREHLPDLERISATATSAISGIHLWFDRPITDLDHAVFVGTNAQWLFRDPCALASNTESPTTVESDPIVSDTATSGDHYYQVVISASAEILADGKDAVLRTVMAELRSFFPECRDARLLKSRLVTDPKSVFSATTEFESLRPSQKTTANWLFLAGDWTQTGWPATMEGAVISGQRAAKFALQTLSGSPAPRSLGVDEGLPKNWLARLLIRA